MENKRGKKKEKIALILLLLVLCCGVVTGVVLFNQKNNNQVSNEDTDTKKPVDKTEVSKVSSNQYTVIVKSDTGVVLPNVLVSIYDAEGNMITVPEATDAVGRLLYTPEEEGIYGACVMAAPHQYALDRQIYYFETGKNILSIVLKEDPTAYVAKIGDANYTLRGAISAANASTEDVTITLLHDVYVVNDLGINNKNGKTITIDGGGKRITYLANTNLFAISQNKGTVNFKNMIVDHNGAGAVFRTSNAINLNLTDVTILAQNDTEGFYKWSLINLFGKGKTNLTMTRVKIDMDINTIESDAAGAAIIRTGNEGNVKDIKITMNDCYIDATGAKGRAGIRVTPDTTADVVFNNTKFLTQNNYVVAVDGQLKWSETNSTLSSLDEYYKVHPIPDVIATVAGTEFYSLNAAVKKASQLGGKEPVKIVGNVALPSSTTFSGNGITAIIDGNGHTLTAEGGNTIFKINANNYNLTFRNMTINHSGHERLLQYEAKKENINVTWENVTVVASGTTEDACYKYGLINLRGGGSFTMKSSSITLDVPKIINGSAPGVIRTGNANDGQKLTICLDNSKINASSTTSAYGIYVQKGATTDIVLKNYEIHTNNRYPIYVHADDGDATLTYDNMDTWSCKNGSVNFLCNLTSLMNMKDAAKIGNTVYRTLPEAFKAAQEAGGDVTITLLRDCKLLARTDFKTEHSSITIDGDGKYSLSTAGSALIFVLDNDNVSLTLKDLVVDHKGYDRFITFNKKSEGVYDEVNVIFDNVKMNASGTTDGKCYPYGIFNLRASGAFTMIDSTITSDVTAVFGGNGYGVFRLGNAKDGQTVEITMTNSTIDASKTKDIAGIYVQEGATAQVKTSNSTIKTNNKHAINVNSKGKLLLPQTDTQWSSVDTTIKSITNCKTVVDNVCYMTFTDAWNVAKESKKATTITLLNDCTVTKALGTIKEAGTKITLDGEEKYSLTTTANAQMFMLGENDVALTFKNLVIEHQGNDRFVTTSIKSENPKEIYTGVNVVFDNVQMTASGATADSCYKYGLFNLRASGAFTMIDSTIKLDVEKTTGGADCGVIRLGNANDGHTVEITMKENSTIDASKTKNIAGINVSNGAKAEVETLNSTIKTNNKYAINVNSTGSVKLAQPEPNWSCTDQNITSITNCVAKIGDVYYGGLAGAWDAAESGNTVYILNDIQFGETLVVGSEEESKELTITNIAGKDVTITRTSKTALFSVASGSTLTLGDSADDKNKLIIDGGYDKDAETPLKTVPLVSNAGTFTLETNATIQNAVTGGSSNNDNYRGGALNNKANATATISGTIRECSAFNGGAIYNAKSGTVIITEGAYFTKNTADGGNGGAIRNEGTVRITKATFIDNEGKGSNGNGGVIYNTGTLTTTDAIFEENIAKKSGGAIYNATSTGKMTITGGIFTGNIATTENGGAIYIKYDSGAVSITNAEFMKNSSKNNNSAAIDVRKAITLSSCNIHDNVASETSTNAIYDINIGDSSNKGTLTLAGNTNTGVVYLTNGSVQVQADFTGEAILVPKTYTSGTKLITFAEGITDKASVARKIVIGKVVSGQVYRSDKYYVDADGILQAHTEVAKVGDRYTTLEEAISSVQTSENTTIYLLNNATVSATLEIGTQSAPKNITIVNAAGEGATITRTNKSALFTVASGSTLTLGSQDTANEFTVDGGYDKDAETPLKTVPLVSNAGTFTLEANATIQNAVTGGSSNNDNYRGGALNNKANATATISGTIRGCSAFNGGAIYNAKSGTVIITEGACLTGNTADGGNGGAIRNEGTVRITKATFTNNEGKGSNGNGGVIYNTGTLTTTDATFEENIAKKSGGAIYNATSTGKMTITGGVFTGNSATTENGGAIYVKYDSGTVSITNVEITQNSSKNNNSAAIDARQSLTISGCNIHDNVASETSSNAVYDINVGDSSNKETLTLAGNTNAGVVYLTNGNVQVQADFTGEAILVPKTYTEGTPLITFAKDITNVSSMLDKLAIDKDGYYIDSEGKLQKRSRLFSIISENFALTRTKTSAEIAKNDDR